MSTGIVKVVRISDVQIFPPVNVGSVGMASVQFENGGSRPHPRDEATPALPPPPRAIAFEP